MQRDSCYRCLPPSVPVRTSCFAEKTATKNKRGEKDSGRRHPALHRQGLRILQTNRVPMLRMTPTMWTKRQKFQTDLGRHNGHASIFSADVRGRVRRHLRTSRGDDQRGHGNTLCLPSVSLSLSCSPFSFGFFSIYPSHSIMRTIRRLVGSKLGVVIFIYMYSFLRKSLIQTDKPKCCSKRARLVLAVSDWVVGPIPVRADAHCRMHTAHRCPCHY